MLIISSYITLFLSIFMIFLIATIKNKSLSKKDRIAFILIFSLMTVYSSIGLFWILVSDSEWIYDYNEILYLIYNILILKNFYNFLKKD